MATLSEQFIQKAVFNPLQNQKCSELHPGVSCNKKMFLQFMGASKSLYKMYLLVHLVPFILFKRKKLVKKPFHQIKNLIQGFIKSLLFAAGYTAVARRIICFITEHYKYTSSSAIIAAIINWFTLNFQPQGRQSEIALFCVNKTLETTYNMALRRGYPVRVLYGQSLVFGIGVAIICYYYVDCPNAIRQSYKKLLDQIFGNI